MAWRRLEQVLAADSQIAWLYGVAYRVLSNQRRGIGRGDRLRFKLIRQRPAGLHTDPADTTAGDPDVAAVFQALSELSAVEQELIRLVAFEELSYGEISAVTGMQVGSVRSRLYRARRHLQEAATRRTGRDYPPVPDTSTDMRAANPSGGSDRS